MTFRLYGFRSEWERLLCYRYTSIKASRSNKSTGYRVKAIRDEKGRLKGWELFRRGSKALIERVNLERDEVIRYFRGSPIDKTRLSYMIGAYHLQEEIESTQEVL